MYNKNILDGTWGTDGWAIYSPLCRGIRHDTFRATRKESIEAAGCYVSKNWKELYKDGFRAVRVSAGYDLPKSLLKSHDI